MDLAIQFPLTPPGPGFRVKAPGARTPGRETAESGNGLFHTSHFYAIRHPANPGRVHPEDFTHFRALGFVVTRASCKAKKLGDVFVVGLRLGSPGNLRLKLIEKIDQYFKIVAHLIG